MAEPFGAARIVGVATTDQARSLAPRTAFSLGLEALKLALHDAGLAIADVDGIASRVSDFPYDRMSWRAEATAWAWQLKRPLTWTDSDTTIASLLDAAMAIESGVASTIALILAQVRPRDPERTAPWTRPETEFTGWTGSYTAVQYALVAQRYVHDHGPDALQAFAEAAAAIRNFGHLNPDAVYAGRGPFDARQVLESREISSPLTVLMCSAVNDGACAVVLTHRDRVVDEKRAVRIVAGTQRHSFPAYVEPPIPAGVTDETAHFNSALARAGLKHDDIDVIELYDNFASEVVIELERYGFCRRGEAAQAVSSGATRLRGRFPTCTDGGLLSYSHNGTPALYRPVEAVRQLRGEIADGCPGWREGTHTHEEGVCRLVPDIELAFASNPSAPTGGGSFVVLARG